MSVPRQEISNVVALRPRTALNSAPNGAALGDMRFRALLGAQAWGQLPVAVQARFSKRLSGTASVVYRGEVVECRLSRLGSMLAQVLRIMGAPLPLASDTLVPAVVTVTEDEASGGQFWTRQYGHHRGFPQLIQSTKRFAGPTGLEEYVGGGIGVALALTVRDGALMFISDHYFMNVGGWRMRLPRWITPGRLTVGHTDCGDGWFAFTLSLDHRWFGNLMAQTALFSDAP
jgi:hypothetical protein